MVTAVMTTTTPLSVLSTRMVGRGRLLGEWCAFAVQEWQRGGQRCVAAAAAAEVARKEHNDTLGVLLRKQLSEIEAAGTYKHERVITSGQEAEIRVAGRQGMVLNLCANNYLGLSNHPHLVEAARRSLESHGYGLSSVRFICGTQDIHKQLEERLTRFHGTEDSILYASCFDANAGLFESILTKEDAVISDALNHASIIDGIRLCKASRFVYKHMDMADLESKLVEARHSRVRLIATDGVFSMDGDIAPLKEIVMLAKKHDALVFIDECHASGFLGRTGRGTDELCGVYGQIDVINSTLGKALGGGTGGYTTGRRDIVEILRQKARPYLFSNTLAPPVVGASIAALDMLMESTALRDTLEENTNFFRGEMKKLGFDIREGEHPIVPIMLGDARLAAEMSDKLLEKGVYVIGFSYPVVPKGLARIRVQISASHTRDQLQYAIASFADVGRELGVIN